MQALGARAVRMNALMSPDRAHRYRLDRVWDDALPILLWAMLNSSTADHIQNDPTITRVIDFTKRFGYGGAFILNLFALRSPDPAKLREAGLWAFGNQNTVTWNNTIADASGKNVDGRPVMVAAWGTHGKFLSADKRYLTLFKDRVRFHCLKTTKDGFPAHPLYLPKTCELQPYDFEPRFK